MRYYLAATWRRCCAAHPEKSESSSSASDVESSTSISESSLLPADLPAFFFAALAGAGLALALVPAFALGLAMDACGFLVLPPAALRAAGFFPPAAFFARGFFTPPLAPTLRARPPSAFATAPLLPPPRAFLAFFAALLSPSPSPPPSPLTW
eukprot:170242-Chlamydomonas_euryale.AAC.18